jgi:hypothetical protein
MSCRYLHSGKMDALPHEMRAQTVFQQMDMSTAFGQPYLSRILLKESEDLRA